MYILPLLNSAFTGPKFTKRLHDVARSSALNILKSELRYSNPFWNAKAMNANESADFSHFDPKIVCHGKVP